MDAVALFSGCLIPYREPGLELAARNLLGRLGVRVVTLPFNCCGARTLESASREAWLTLSARNLALARAAGVPILTLCGSCTGTLTRASIALRDPDLKDSVNRLLKPRGLEYRDEVPVIHILKLLASRMGDPALDSVNPGFKQMKAALSLPCQLIRPGESATLASETIIDLVSRYTGQVHVIPQCCGATYGAMDPRAGEGMLRDNLAFAADNDCELIVTGCGNCQFAYDYVQASLIRRQGADRRSTPIPAVYIAQLAAFSAGLNAKESGLEYNRIKL